MAAGIVPSGRVLAQQVVIGLVTALAVAWIIGNTPALKSWFKAQED